VHPYDGWIGLRLAITALAWLVALAVAVPATAAEIVHRDREGRAIHLDVRANVDAGWYSDHLRDAAHADEISSVTIRIVDWDELRSTCGRAASGCYSRRSGRELLVVPAGNSHGVAHTLLHEYGHHVDASRRHGGLREPNGTPLWWRARSMAELVELEAVARSYRLGWDRSIAEIFAEDFAYLNVGGPYRIDWLRPPSSTVRAAIRADLGLGAAPPIAQQPPALRPVVISRSGTLAPSTSESVPFGLLGPNRRVTFTASLSGPGSGRRARLVIECDGDVHTRTLGAGLRTATIDLPSIGPARCRANLANVGTSNEQYRFTLRLSIRR
jgi:hypothetical protein